MVGTHWLCVTRSRAISASASAGWKRGWPIDRAAGAQQVHREPERCRVVERRGGQEHAVRAQPEQRAGALDPTAVRPERLAGQCARLTPLGRPVVPEVYSRSPPSSAGGSGASARRERLVRATASPCSGSTRSLTTNRAPLSSSRYVPLRRGQPASAAADRYSPERCAAQATARNSGRLPMSSATTSPNRNPEPVQPTRERQAQPVELAVCSSARRQTRRRCAPDRSRPGWLTPARPGSARSH